MAALVIQNHLALSEDEPHEYVCQILDLQVDFGFLLDPEEFARGFCLVAIHKQSGTVVGSAGTYTKFFFISN